MNTLQIDPSSPWWIHAGAALILYAHIAGGTLGMISGAAALAFRKGSPNHRLAGNIFFVSMLAMASVGALVAPFLLTATGEAKRFDSIAGFLTLYLVATGWMAARRKAGTTGGFELGAFAFAVLLAGTCFAFGVEAAQRPSGTLGGYGPSGYHAFAALLALAAALDLNAILRGGLTGVPRVARHVWRMSLALFIALASFFLGQQRVMPEWMQGSSWLGVPPLAVLALMVFWLVKLRLSKMLGRLARERRLRREQAAAA